ncbi:zinc-ribbon domain-containing protein [Lacticaseibacillus baoqingensis]|uniref:Zinc-ribbon domain-containing protein n=1 Tax=Lacticaseibacillus baoqingensis TaxID=2486013 RepID=A0ABW4EA19_9LACO|nr:zinc ribbon domain-containing protein [Lacticaseibacillus baoqingensis]
MSEETGMAFCPQCGGKVPDNAKFCPNCGHKLEFQSVPDKLEKQEVTISESTAKPNENGAPTGFKTRLRWLKSFIDKAKSIYTRAVNSKKYITYSIIPLFVIIGLIWYKTSSTDVANAVEGKIFAYQMLMRPVNNKYVTTGYIAFGDKKDDFGSLHYLSESKNEIKKLNNEKTISSDVSEASKSNLLFWDTENNGSTLTWPNGLAFPTAQENPIMPNISITVNKVSGIFRKTLSGTGHSGGENSRNFKVRLVEIGRIKD